MNENYLLHEFAYDVNGIEVYPDNATSTINYNDGRGNRLIFKAENSTSVTPHFSYTPDTYEYYRTETNSPHTEIINQIQTDGFLEYDNVKIEPNYIVIEKATIENERIIPDLTFYDYSDNIMCLVEVVVTHFCEEEKIKILTDKDILTIEIKYDRESKEQETVNIFGSRKINNTRERIIGLQEGIEYDEKEHQNEYWGLKEDKKKIISEISRIRDQIKLYEGGIEREFSDKIRNRELNIKEIHKLFNKKASNYLERFSDKARSNLLRSH